ncbi:MAG TPA: class I SAM-dependent methyltransferase [Longimicrobiales bacterium]|nr:class I SAM-dependent methyltransferase [Longimicrobiales bacterium]
MSGRTAYDVAGHYDAGYYQDLAARYRTRNRFARQRIANVLSLLPPLDGRVLVDIGCGMGTFTVEAARRGARALGVDFAPEALPAAAAVARAEGAEQAWFTRADAVRMPLRDQSADVVVAADITEHLDDATLRGVLGDVRRVLRSGGSLVVYTPENSHIFERLRDAGVMKQDPSHIGVRSAQQLADEVRAAGLAVVDVRWLPSHLPVLNLLERGLARWVPLLRRRIGIVARKS